MFIHIFCLYMGGVERVKKNAMHCWLKGRDHGVWCTCVRVVVCFSFKVLANTNLTHILCRVTCERDCHHG